MYRNVQHIILASASPRRQQYLSDMGLQFSVQTAAILENPLPDEVPEAFVNRMAREKAAAVREAFPDEWIISGDTVVCLGRRILGKPKNAEDAVDILMTLSGREHHVWTGFCLVHGGREVEIVRSVVTKVRFAAFTESTVRAYVVTEEGLDKAGAYAIQGKGASLVQSIEGSYTNVVGLPLYEVLQVLETFGIIEPSPPHESAYRRRIDNFI